MDTVSTTVRSRNMSAVKHRYSETECRLRLVLWAAGIRYRMHVRIFGTPNRVIAKVKVAVFVDSCFWHGCRYHDRCPQSTPEFRRSKIDTGQ